MSGWCCLQCCSKTVFLFGLSVLSPKRKRWMVPLHWLPSCPGLLVTILWNTLKHEVFPPVPACVGFTDAMMCCIYNFQLARLFALFSVWQGIKKLWNFIESNSPPPASISLFFSFFDWGPRADYDILFWNIWFYFDDLGTALAPRRPPGIVPFFVFHCGDISATRAACNPPTCVLWLHIPQ